MTEKDLVIKLILYPKASGDREVAKNIAIVDDEPEMEFFYSQMLEDLTLSGKVRLHFFSDSRLFFSWVQNNPIDLLLTDINMPHLSGAELTRKVQITLPNIPTYFVSGFEEHAYQKVMQELGIQRFLEKPLDFDKILEFIQEDLHLA